MSTPVNQPSVFTYDKLSSIKDRVLAYKMIIKKYRYEPTGLVLTLRIKICDCLYRCSLEIIPVVVFLSDHYRYNRPINYTSLGSSLFVSVMVLGLHIDRPNLRTPVLAKSFTQSTSHCK